MTLVRYESAGHVATITMDRASAHNALNNALVRRAARGLAAVSRQRRSCRGARLCRRSVFFRRRRCQGFPGRHVARGARTRRRTRQAGDCRDIRLGGRRRLRAGADGRHVRGLGDDALQLSRSQDRHHRRRRLVGAGADAAQDRDGVPAGRRRDVGRTRLPDRLRQQGRAEGPACRAGAGDGRQRSPPPRRWWCRR